jgi:hypothetical protein
MASTGANGESAKTRMRSRPATGTASSVNSCFRCLSPRSGAMTASTNSLRRVPPWSKPITDAASLRSQIRNGCGTPAALSAPKSGWGIEAATPGLPVALGAFLEVFPAAIRFRQLPPATGSAAIIQQNQERSRFAAITVNQSGSTGQQKTPAALCRTCGRCHFPVEGRGKLRRNSEGEFGPSAASITCTV